ncbi:MAG TPA: hypothetical protein VF458_00035 [Ktedonobacteraceae bacterium]
MEITRKRRQVREESAGYACEDTLAAGVARGRYEEHQNICKVMRKMLVEIAEARFPTIAAFLDERINNIDNFAVLHQFTFVISTAWAPEDILRFILALDDAQEYMR